MALRVVKLAREVELSPAEVLGLLHAVGYVRYKSANDMIGDAAIRRVRQAIRDGVQPVHLEVAAPKPKAVSQPVASSSDFMASLVPGVIRTGETVPVAKPRGGEPRRTAAPAPAPAVAATPAPAPVPAAAVPVANADEVNALQARIASLESELNTLRARVADLAQPPPLTRVLEERGLRGRDELERVLGGLAQRRLLLDAIGAATLVDGGRLAELLRRRVLLVDGAAPQGVPESFVPVAVSPERAELPRPSQIDAMGAKIGEMLMLHGRRSIAIFGGDPLHLHLLSAALDSRVHLVRGSTDGLEGERAVIVHWNEPISEASQRLKGEGAVVVRAERGWGEFARALESGLESA
ncbi:MAG: hypothetical protein KC912_04915 [Proteobacteria bacterium]|nr:hypothetical protein [Pseudomonadota bacterium]